MIVGIAGEPALNREIQGVLGFVVKCHVVSCSACKLCAGKRYLSHAIGPLDHRTSQSARITSDSKKIPAQRPTDECLLVLARGAITSTPVMSAVTRDGTIRESQGLPSVTLGPHGLGLRRLKKTRSVDVINATNARETPHSFLKILEDFRNCPDP